MREVSRAQEEGYAVEIERCEDNEEVDESH